MEKDSFFKSNAELVKLYSGAIDTKSNNQSLILDTDTKVA